MNINFLKTNDLLVEVGGMGDYSLTNNGYEIFRDIAVHGANTGGWIRHKRLEFWRVNVGKAVFYLTFIFAVLAVFVPMYCTGSN